MKTVDSLKLSVYFGERDRADGQLLGDALLDLFTQRGVHTSVLLRGAEGFGRLHHLHTDRLLSLSDDLPVVAIAVDRPERIESLLDAVVALARRGLVTLERVRVVDDRTAGVDRTGPVQSLARDEATKLTVHVGRHERTGGTPAALAAGELLRGAGVAGATVLLGVDGTRRGRRTRARLLARNVDVPTLVVAVGSGEAIERALPELGRRLPAATLTLQRVVICKRDGQLLARPPQAPAADPAGLAVWQKLSVYTSQATIVEGLPIHLQVIRGLRGGESAGATSLRGSWGFHGDDPPQTDRFWQLRRHVPVETVTVDTPERCAEAFEVINALTRGSGLVTCETVPALRAASAQRTVGGLRIAGSAA